MMLASPDNLTSALASLGTSSEGDLISMEITKKGVQRRGQTHGDDTVAVLVWTGFEYRALIERSQRKLEALQAKGLITKLALASSERAAGAGIGEVCAAIQETESWFPRVLTVGQAPRFPRETEDVWSPLIVEGKHVHGCRVWNGVPDPDDPKAIVPGTVYLQGVKLGEVILKPAESSWVTRSSPKTVAKDILRSWLPIGLFVQYALTPGSYSNFSTGADAAKMAKAAGILVEPDAVRSLFKVA